MKKLLIATTNPAKFGELSLYLKDLPLKLLSLKDLHITQKVNESGKTFEENALLKANYYCKLSGLPTIADDGGLEIDELKGEPGIKSHRWLDSNKEVSDIKLINYCLDRMKNIPIDKRGAQLRLVLALKLPTGQEFTVEEKVRGIIALKPAQRWSPGFPWRALLYLPQINKYYNELELTNAENQKYNHRRKAVEKIKSLIRKYLNK